MIQLTKILSAHPRTDTSLKNMCFAAALVLGTGTTLSAQTLVTATDIDLKILDPVWTTNAATMTHGLRVYDTLFSMDEEDQPQPQMVGNYNVSNDGLTYRFTLRPGLLFSDGSPVESKDVVASLKRWAVKRPEGQLMNERLEEIAIIDESTFEIRLQQPFALLLRALANPVTPMFVMREEEALTDPAEQIKTVIGSGPYIFRDDLWRPSDLTVYEKSPTYVPRDEPASGQAGGKSVYIDAIHERYIPDSNTSLQALRNGEVDFLNRPPQDAVPQLRENPNLTVDVVGKQGQMGAIRMNTLHPPFDDVNARKAMQLLIDQEGILTAMVGSSDRFTVCYSIFGCGPVPNETHVGTEEWAGQDIEKAREYLEKSSYDGEPIVVLVPSDNQLLSSLSLVLVEYMKQAGFTVDAQSMDWATITNRRANMVDPAVDPKTGWHVFATFVPGSYFKDPLSIALVATGDPETAWYGWPNDPKLEELRAAWIDAPTAEDQRRLIDEIQKQYYTSIPQVYTGQFFMDSVWSKDVTGILPSEFPIFWNVKKAE